MKNSPKSIGSSYGLFLGLLLILLSTIAYALNLALLTKWWYGLIGLLILLTVAILGVRKAKKMKAGDHFSFKNAYTTYFLVVLIGTFIATVYSILLFVVIDPEAAETVTDLTIEATRSMMEGFGAPEASINEALAAMEDNNQFTIKNQLKNFVFGLGFYLLVGLLVALVFREKDPNKM